MTARERWLEKLKDNLLGDGFVKFTLSKPRKKNSDLRNVYARIVDLKSGRSISLTLRYTRRDETRNIAFEEGIAQARSLLADVFEEARLFTLNGDWRLRANAHGEGEMKATKATFLAAPSTAHDKPKVHALTNAPFLMKLGVTSSDGKPRPGMADKLRQVERFVEILGHLVEASSLRDAEEVSACDMGAGKGYLTFAAHEFFSRQGKIKMIGIEQRAELVEQTQAIARELGSEGLQFITGDIATFTPPERLDLLIALHACDTATDDALAAGIHAGAPLIMVAPCCHKEIRSQMLAPAILKKVLAHGILAERQAELLTDGLRAMVLEAHGYEAKVFEFISNEHTGKNIMISATKRGSPDGERLKSARAVIGEFGISKMRLLDLLAQK